MKHKKITISSIILMFSLTLFYITRSGESIYADNITSENIGAVYVDEYGGYKWGSGRIDPLYKDVYSSGLRMIEHDTDVWKIDEYRGSTDCTKTVTVESGTKISASFSSPISDSIIKATLGMSLEGTYKKSVQTTYTFLGDGKPHSLMQTMESTVYEIYTDITSSACYPTSWDWYPIIGYTNIKWGPWVELCSLFYDPSGVINQWIYHTYITP